MKRRFNRQQRSTARLGVVQLLFANQSDEAGIDIDDVLNFFDEEWERPDLRFMHNRFKSCCENSNAIELHILSGLQPGWSIDRVDPVLCAIMIAATDEMLDPSKATPLEILVKEYADLTADFFDKSETSFINAYLNDLKVKLNQISQENR